MPQVNAFFDPATYSYSYVVAEPNGCAAVIDPVLDFDPAAARTSTHSADVLIAFVNKHQLTVDWILETHVHADHLSAAQHIAKCCGGQVVTGQHVRDVQHIFANTFNVADDFSCEQKHFDRLVADGEHLPLGSLDIEVIETPGHTPGCVTYLIGDAAFVGDTLFMPDYGTARTDFPGGDARTLYRSIQTLFKLPGQTIVYLCHDYGTDTRKTFCGKTTVDEAIRNNIHIHSKIGENQFVRLRESRDKTLSTPRLLYPAVQFNMRGGRMPPAEGNGRRYLKLPICTD